MLPLTRALPLLGLFALAGCSSMGSTEVPPGPMLAAPNSQQMQAPMQNTMMTPPPSQQIATAQSMTDVSAFVDPGAIPLLSANDRSQASSAQFNALSFGRVGAPRAWQGDRGTSGQIVVGPFVRVNAIDCRDFTHTVTVGGKPYAKKGTACREADGSWSVTNIG